MLFQVFNQLSSGRFLDLQSAEVNQLVVFGRIGVHPGFLKGIFGSVDGEKGTFSGGFHQAIAAAIVLARYADGKGDLLPGKLVSHIVAVNPGSDGGDEIMGRVKKSHGMGNIVGTTP